ncbi:SP3-like protein [Mya arenaria]|uniref:SP3-like protein n=1 Tax=Mya arenaria TaxID=6604 RepID=A0ABY7F7P2_MYAAR|nr:uncharacterized protein LOC128205696 [Mya arenaria]XP_052763507.1 uncharacterized protein LOC128205696 [Mya arenaria]XP_052763508.1 uncharacterized protein LOC128205696 [Mya arenaria]XP_052774890.1 uncharacterized protein LOC128213325 [Mya arenaria]WAR18135.1 SP3-like protein [Mya arenaria]WAR24603.1 SP3-like protein [Mya arenaria]
MNSPGPDMDVIKEVPGYKVILKAVLRAQIQQLVEQLCSNTDEEVVVLTASIHDGSLTQMGSACGNSFIQKNYNLRSKFLSFCLQSNHNKTDRSSANRSNQSGTRRANRSNRGTPRHQPYTSKQGKKADDPNVQSKLIMSECQTQNVDGSDRSTQDGCYDRKTVERVETMTNETVRSYDNSWSGVYRIGDKMVAMKNNEYNSPSLTKEKCTSMFETNDVHVTEENYGNDEDVEPDSYTAADTSVQHGLNVPVSIDRLDGTDYLTGKKRPNPACNNDQSSDSSGNDEFQILMKMTPVAGSSVPSSLACDLCDKHFTFASNLYRHKRLHEKQRAHQCPHCEYRSSRSDHIRLHVYTMHRDKEGADSTSTGQPDNLTGQEDNPTAEEDNQPEQEGQVV